MYELTMHTVINYNSYAVSKRRSFMLISCPECGLQVSNKAFMCPHCGNPLKEEAVKKIKKRSTRRKRLPNGFGQITKIKNSNLRKEYRAMITVGKTEFGKPICKLLKPISYFSTYNEAYEALLKYNQNPYNLNDCMTLEEVYEKWSVKHFAKLSTSIVSTHKNAWKYCDKLYTMKISDIRTKHIKLCIDNVQYKNEITRARIQSRVKSIFNLIFDYALEYELVDKNYARNFTLDEDIITKNDSVKKKHMPFTSDDLELLWSCVYSIPYADLLLIQSYTGLRPKELCLVEVANMHLDKDYFVAGMKTKAGTNRLIPIHPRIKNLITTRYNRAIENNSLYVFNVDDIDIFRPLNYNLYSFRFKRVLSSLNIDPSHSPHDPRVTFVTTAKKYNVDEYAIKYIVGHSINDITEEVYTQREDSWLLNEIKKIK